MARLTEFEKENGLKKTTSRSYNTGKTACGTPEDLYKRMNLNGPRVCPECYKRRTMLRVCKKCEKPFVPGCKARFLCVNCYLYNRDHDY